VGKEADPAVVKAQVEVVVASLASSAGVLDGCKLDADGQRHSLVPRARAFLRAAFARLLRPIVTPESRLASSPYVPADPLCGG
jgi:hypothetical protein